MLPESDRKDLAIQALARSTTISDLSVRHSVSRKFVYQQAHKACSALDDVFLSGTPEEGVLFQFILVLVVDRHDISIVIGTCCAFLFCLLALLWRAPMALA